MPSRKQRDDPRTRRKYFQITCPPLTSPGLGSWLCERWEGVRRRGGSPCPCSEAPPVPQDTPSPALRLLRPPRGAAPHLPHVPELQPLVWRLLRHLLASERLPQPQGGVRRKVTLGGELLGTGRQGCPDLTESSGKRSWTEEKGLEWVQLFSALGASSGPGFSLGSLAAGSRFPVPASSAQSQCSF